MLVGKLKSWPRKGTDPFLAIQDALREALGDKAKNVIIDYRGSTIQLSMNGIEYLIDTMGANERAMAVKSGSDTSLPENWTFADDIYYQALCCGKALADYPNEIQIVATQNVD